MSKKTIFYLSFAAITVLGFYLLLSAMIPGFNEKKINPVSEVRPFRFITQDGKDFTNADVAGKVYVAEYFFTTCPGICPVMNNNLRTVYERFKGNPNFLILSHTCDPDRDSVPVLKRYADSMNVNTKQWIFLTGRKDSLYYTARLSYAIDDPKDNLANIQDQFMHTQHWALVNTKGEVVRVYDGLKKKEIEGLIVDIEKMLKP